MPVFVRFHRIQQLWSGTSFHQNNLTSVHTICNPNTLYQPPNQIFRNTNLPSNKPPQSKCHHLSSATSRLVLYVSLKKRKVPAPTVHHPTALVHSLLLLFYVLSPDVKIKQIYLFQSVVNLNNEHLGQNLLLPFKNSVSEKRDSTQFDKLSKWRSVTLLRMFVYPEPEDFFLAWNFPKFGERYSKVIFKFLNI